MMCKTIKECREQKNLSIKEMSLLLGINTEEYERYELYEREMTILQGVQFAHITQTPLSEIIFFAQ